MLETVLMIAAGWFLAAATFAILFAVAVALSKPSPASVRTPPAEAMRLETAREEPDEELVAVLQP